MRLLSTILEVLGLLAVVAGAALVDYRAGMVAGGVVLVLIGLAMDPPVRRLE